MTVFDHHDYDGHERVLFCSDPASGLHAIIALHSTRLGPAAGGCRFWRYESDAFALTDALRLSRGMSYKNAIAELAFGGGKSVIMAPPDRQLTDAMLEAFGDFVNSLRGDYVTAEDVGMSVRAMQVVARRTPHVSGLPPEGGNAGGDPSPKTAWGVFCGIEAAVRHRLDRADLGGLKVAVQGVGNVGYQLCRLLAEAGASLSVADIDEQRVDRVRDEFGARAVALDEVLYEPVDVIAPCALGAVLNEVSIPRIGAPIVAGGANNQLATDADGRRLFERGILYAPDYVINSGGIVSCACEYEGGYTEREVMERIAEIGPRLERIFLLAEQSGEPTNEVADRMARQIIAAG